jgi:predicted alpha/beta-fold hydrolase
MMNHAKHLAPVLVRDPASALVRDLRDSAKSPADQSTAAAWWARNPHFQTTLGRLGRSRHLVTFRREVLTTPDDDDLVLDHVDGPPSAPRVLLLHGLEGDRKSVV